MKFSPSPLEFVGDTLAPTVSVIQPAHGSFQNPPHQGNSRPIGGVDSEGWSY